MHNSKVKLTEEVKNCLLGILEKYPRETLHYAPRYEGDNRTVRYNGGLSIAHFYIQDFLKCGSDHDHRAYAQFTHTKYLPGFTLAKKKPSMEQYEEDTEGLMLKPSITYGTCRKFYYDCNIKFED